MTWVARVNEYIGVKVLHRLFTVVLALTSSVSALASAARASTLGLLDDGPGRIVPMYGVPVTIGPVVKYGPPPIPTATISPIGPGVPSFDWGSAFPSWSFGDKLSMNFTAPDFSHMMPSFPKLFGMLAFIAYASLFLAAVCGLALRGSGWYLKNRGKTR
jgi:hypothetical protein